MALINHKFLLAARPVGMPKRSDWTFIEEPVGEPKEGELLVQVLYISLDPAMRMWVNEARSYIPPVGIGELMRALGVGIVDSVAQPRLRGRRSCFRLVRGTGVCADQWPDSEKNRPENRSAAQASQCAWHAGHDCIFWPSRHRPAEAGRHGCSFGSSGRCRLAGGTDRKNKELPCCGHCRRSREMPLHCA